MVRQTPQDLPPQAPIEPMAGGDGQEVRKIVLVEMGRVLGPDLLGAGCIEEFQTLSIESRWA